MRRLLDLFCGAGGATRGYQQAGFHVTGIDLAPQPRYCGDVFLRNDALAYVAAHGHEYDCIHASPPCQAYSVLKHLARHGHPALIDATRTALAATGQPYVIENVVGAPLQFALLLCGSMFALQTPCGAQLRRHRLFESTVWLLSPGECSHSVRTVAVNGHEFRNEATRWMERRTITVTGSTPQRNVVRNRIRETFSVRDAQIAMGIDWMGMRDLAQAIPPAYTCWIGQQLQTWLQRRQEG